jgi:glycosyl hydrolase family 76
VAVAARNAARELAGSGDGSIVGWDPANGRWARFYRPPHPTPGWRAPSWWQTALALSTLIRYLDQTNDSAPVYQRLIARTYQRNISLPGTKMPLNFANNFMDDSVWWGISWLDAARYELNVRGDLADAFRYLRLAEWDAGYVYSRPRPCHAEGIAWQSGYPPDAVTNEEFVALAAQLAWVRRASGPFHDPRKAQTWLVEARRVLAWLQDSGLVDMAAGKVYDSYDRHCRVTGGPVTYSEGEMAEALTQMGRATGDPAYFGQAAAFINWVLSPASGMVAGGVLQQPCEAKPGLCVAERHAYDAESYKGLFVGAVADWTAATEATTYDAFLQAQGEAVLANSASDGRHPTHCQTPRDCVVGFYWSRRVAPAVSPILATPGSQESGLAALSAALQVSTPDSSATAEPMRRGWAARRVRRGSRWPWRPALARKVAR